MTPIPSIGETVIIYPPNGIEIEHLWVIATGVTASGEAVMFNFTGWTMRNDHTCILNIGDHDFITKKTIIEYQRGILLTPFKWQGILDKSDQVKSHKPVSNELLKKIQTGALHPDGRAEIELQDIVRQFLIK
jgi:hypothetical protein